MQKFCVCEIFWSADEHATVNGHQIIAKSCLLYYKVSSSQYSIQCRLSSAHIICLFIVLDYFIFRWLITVQIHRLNSSNWNIRMYEESEWNTHIYFDERLLCFWQPANIHFQLKSIYKYLALFDVDARRLYCCKFLSCDKFCCFLDKPKSDVGIASIRF